MSATVRDGLIAGLVLPLFLLSVGRAGAEPVTLAVKAPRTSPAGARFAIRVTVRAVPGALEIASRPLRLRVRMARECGGTFAGTGGVKVMDRRLRPQPGAERYRIAERGATRLHGRGRRTVCAFLEDSEHRQFATSTHVQVRLTHRHRR